MIRIHRQADRGRTAQTDTVRRDDFELFDGTTDALGNDNGGFLSRLRQQRNEFVATVAGQDVTIAQGALDLTGEALQVGIADRVPVSVVDQLEVVEVDQQQAEAVAMTLGAADLVG